ncbi:hypothetical protein KSP39_PZI001945 [Platanthera zijinensis]|uniref:Protein PAM68, chloroplastic n=1 Tax=Platanthera zijinensis TaxID=2320716 RepID=A0AAP0GDZ5_9ASPA
MAPVLHFLLPASFPRLHFIPPSSSSHFTRTKTLIPQPPSLRPSPLSPAAVPKSPKGFGPNVSSKKPKGLKQKTGLSKEEDEEEDDEEEIDEAGETIPEVVTNRMMRRMGLSVGIPLAVGVLFFPFFYYLKVVAKIDVPTWIPFLVSFFFFGASLLGISYGIVSTSWDPLREGSLLGWNEARRNWPCSGSLFVVALARSSSCTSRARWSVGRLERELVEEFETVELARSE